MFFTTLLSLFVHATLAAQPGPVTEVVDPAAGPLVDFVQPGLEISSAVIVSPSTADHGVEVRELRGGKVQDDDVHPEDAQVEAHLLAGEEVLIYRDAGGAVIVKAG